jgi:putative inorganic carbon (HCO3(-)) transporter
MRRARALVPPAAGLFQYLAIAMLLIYLWRIQDLIRILGQGQFPKIVALAAIALFFMNGHATRLIPWIKTPIMSVVTFILVWMVASVPLGIYKSYSLGFIYGDHAKVLVMMAILLASIRSMADVERLALSSMLGACGYCIVILLAYDMANADRLGGLIYYDSNDLSMMIVCTLPFAVYFLRPNAKAWQRLAALFCLGVFVLAIVAGGSRGGFLGLVCVGGFLVFGFRAIPARVRIGATVASAVFLAAVGTASYWDRMGTFFDITSDYNLTDEIGRIEIWKRGAGYLASNPLTGVGVNAFPIAEGSMSEQSARQAEGIGFKWSTAHSSFVQIAAELGVPGIIAFLLLLWRLYTTAQRMSRSTTRRGPLADDERAFSQALVGTLIGYVICGSLLSQAYSAYLYVLCGIVTALAVVTGDPVTIRSMTGAGRGVPRAAPRYARRASPAQPAAQ